MIEVATDAFLFKGVLSNNQQRQLVDLYIENQKDFYRPRLKSGHYMSLQTTCFGHHWSAADYKYHATRTDVDNEVVKPMPEFLQEMAETFSLASFPNEKAEFDIAIANYYSLESKLGMHSDNSETHSSLRGKPIASFSVGADCIFRFGGRRRNDSHVDIRLSSGDVFVFGGSARKNYHGVTKVMATEDVFNSELDDGRLNFTLRKL